MPERGNLSGLRRLERGVTPQRLAAAKRTLKKERDAAPLFAAEIAAAQPSPEERIASMDAGHAAWWQTFRDGEAKTWRKARAALPRDPAARRARLVAWRACSWPKSSAYFCEWLRKQGIVVPLPGGGAPRPRSTATAS